MVMYRSLSQPLKKHRIYTVIYICHIGNVRWTMCHSTESNLSDPHYINSKLNNLDSIIRLTKKMYLKQSNVYHSLYMKSVPIIQNFINKGIFFLPSQKKDRFFKEKSHELSHLKCLTCNLTNILNMFKIQSYLET